MQDFRVVYDRLRQPENRIYVVAGALLLVVTLIVGCLVVYQLIKASSESAQPLLIAPKAVATMTLELPFTAPELILSETSTAPVAKKIAPTARPKPKAKVKPTAGKSCYYSTLRLNQVLPPVPSGSWSPIENYLCNDGYWEIGEGDVVDRKTGDWGRDGVPEKILIKYDSDGKIADRIFIDPDGDQFSGPTQ
jgi:hypothetical protein